MLVQNMLAGVQRKLGFDAATEVIVELKIFHQSIISVLESDPSQHRPQKELMLRTAAALLTIPANAESAFQHVRLQKSLPSELVRVLLATTSSMMALKFSAVSISNMGSAMNTGTKNCEWTCRWCCELLVPLLSHRTQVVLLRRILASLREPETLTQKAPPAWYIGQVLSMLRKVGELGAPGIVGPQSFFDSRDTSDHQADIEGVRLDYTPLPEGGYSICMCLRPAPQCDRAMHVLSIRSGSGDGLEVVITPDKTDSNMSKAQLEVRTFAQKASGHLLVPQAFGTPDANPSDRDGVPRWSLITVNHHRTKLGKCVMSVRINGVLRVTNHTMPLTPKAKANSSKSSQKLGTPYFVFGGLPSSCRHAHTSFRGQLGPLAILRAPVTLRTPGGQVLDHAPRDLWSVVNASGVRIQIANQQGHGGKQPSQQLYKVEGTGVGTPETGVLLGRRLVQCCFEPSDEPGARADPPPGTDSLSGLFTANPDARERRVVVMVDRSRYQHPNAEVSPRLVLCRSHTLFEALFAEGGVPILLPLLVRPLRSPRPQTAKKTPPGSVPAAKGSPPGSNDPVASAPMLSCPLVSTANLVEAMRLVATVLVHSDWQRVSE